MNRLSALREFIRAVLIAEDSSVVSKGKTKDTYIYYGDEYFTLNGAAKYFGKHFRKAGYKTKIMFKSKSGSVYLDIVSKTGKTYDVRISDHEIRSMDPGRGTIQKTDYQILPAKRGGIDKQQLNNEIIEIQKDIYAKEYDVFIDDNERNPHIYYPK